MAWYSVLLSPHHVWTCDVVFACPQVVLLTKIDLPHVAASAAQTVRDLKAAAGHGRVLAISSHGRDNLRELLARTSKLLEQMDLREQGTADE